MRRLFDQILEFRFKCSRNILVGIIYSRGVTRLSVSAKISEILAERSSEVKYSFHQMNISEHCFSPIKSGIAFADKVADRSNGDVAVDS
jgi:hypothetical protein